MADECRDVTGHQPYVDRPVDVGGAAVSLQVDGDDLMTLGQRGKEIDAIDFGVLPGARASDDQWVAVMVLLLASLLVACRKFCPPR